MAYNSEYWVVLGAAAPVLLVAHVVAATQTIDVVRIPAKGWTLASVVLSLAALVLSGFLLVAALNSLQNERDWVSPAVATDLVVVIIFCTLWQLVAWAARRSERRDAHED